MTAFKKILRDHRLAIFLALLTSIIVFSPQVYFRIDHKDDGIYQGIELLPDSPWSARAREVQDGHPNFGSIYYKDGKDNPYLFQPLGSMVVGYMGKMFSLDINNTLLLSRLVLTTVAFLLIYGFVFLLSRNKFVALSSAVVLLLADSILTPSGIFQIVRGISPVDFLRIARPVNPAMIYVLLFGFLMPFWLFYKKRFWLYGVISAILLGLNFYNYFYSWTFLYAFGGLLVLFLLIRKKWKDAIRIASVFFGALLVTIPYGINLYQATLHPAYQEASVRFGMVMTHAPLFVGSSVLVGLAIFLWGFPKEDRQKYFFGLALLLAPFVTMNQQLITGRVMQAAHYHWFFHVPFAVIFTFIVIFHILTRQKWIFFKKILLVFIFAVSIATGAFIQAASYSNGKHDGGGVAIERQKYGPVMKWLNEHAEKEAVVLANNEASHIITIYTPLNVFYHRAGIYSLSATKARLLDIIFSFYRLRGVGVENARDVFFEERKYLSWNIYGMHYRELLGSYAAIPDEKINEILVAYEETLRISTPEWLMEKWTLYEVEYIVWDKKKDPSWRLEQYPFLEEVAAFGDLSIYQFFQDDKAIQN